MLTVGGSGAGKQFEDRESSSILAAMGLATQLKLALPLADSAPG